MAPGEKNVFLSGLGLSPGLAMGEAYLYRDIIEQDIEAAELETEEVNGECRRLGSAIEQAREELSAAEKNVHREIGPSLAEVFRAHRQMLQDPALTEELREEVRGNRLPAEQALRRVFGRWEQRFREMESETFQARDADVADLTRRLLRILMDIESHALEDMPEGSILVARRLLPSDAIFFSLSSPAGFLVEEGSPGSHCALLTRELGIPGVAQIPGAWERISPGQTVMVDGNHGSVVVAPDPANRRRFRRQQQKYEDTLQKAKARCREPAVTGSGQKVPVLANVGSRHDARMAAENGADGVGLYRTEMLYATRDSFPTEEELVEEMSEVLAPLSDQRCVVRLMDIGGDKELPFLESFSESNPFLGRRGIRLLLEYPELLRVQLRALIQLSMDFDLQIMVPMVTVAEDMRRVREALDAAATEMGASQPPPLVALIETPAAALCTQQIARYADSLSIGTNDLTQYTMAAGRDNPMVAHYFQDNHPAVLRLVRMVCQEADNKPVFVCGELAGRLDAVQAVLDAGVQMLSVAPPLIPSVKQAVREVE
jgi:phosphoenolpyruvate-protein phosphotransferase